MHKEIQYLKDKIIDLQKEVILLKEIIKKNEDESLKRLDHFVLDFIDNFETVQMILHDLQKSSSTDFDLGGQYILRLQKKMERILKKYKVNKIDLSGNDIDVTKIKIIDTIFIEGCNSIFKNNGQIHEVLKEGYEIENRILSKAEVVVAKHIGSDSIE